MTIYRQGLLMLGTTVLPVSDVNLDPAIITAARSSAGDQHPTQQTVFGGNPSLTATMPLGSALTVIGLTCLRSTAMNLILLEIDSTTGKTKAGSVHTKVALATSAIAYTVLNSFSVSQGGLATAQVTITGIAATGSVHPFAITTNNAALTLAAQPTLHTLGPATINNVALTGVESVSGDLAHQSSTRTSDGDLYPTQYAWMMGSPTLSIESGNIGGLLTALGLVGAAIATTTKVTFRQRDTAGTIGSTVASITVGAGFVIPGAFGGGVDSPARMGCTVLPASSDGSTHPWTVGT